MFIVSGIYKIENIINHKVYIGQSNNIYRRYKEHFSPNSKLSNTYLHYAIKHYGIENFTFQILKVTYDLDYWEKFYIYWYRSADSNYGYNLTTGGQAGSRKVNDFTYTDEMKKKMSESAKINWSNPEYKMKIIELQNEGKWTDEARNKRAEATRNMWRSGKFKNQAEKLSKRNKGRKMSDEMKLKMKEVSKERELKHSQDYELYLSLGGDLNRNEFVKHYKDGVNDLLIGVKK